MKKVVITFVDGHVEIIPVVDSYFYLFAKGESLTLHLQPGFGTDNEYINYCLWEGDDEFDDCTLDFKKQTQSISMR